MILHINQDSVWLKPGLTERLIELHALGGAQQLSMSQMAEKLNAEFKTSLTRNAIVGRCRRLSLLCDGFTPLKRQLQHVTQTWRPKPMKIFVRVDAPIVPEIALVPESRGEGLTIYQLGFGDCRWPLGEVTAEAAVFSYCGTAAVEGRPYCGAHCRKAYNAPQVRWA